MLAEVGTFDENKAVLIKNFLRMCKPPICLIAYNGNLFDFPLLKEELMPFVDVSENLLRKCIIRRCNYNNY